MLSKQERRFLMEARYIVEIITDKKLESSEKAELVKEYVKNLSDPKILDVVYDKDTALTAAVHGNYPECVQILIDAKADVDAKPKECMLSPLHWAAYEGYSDCLKLLIEAKANVNTLNMHGNTALGFAAGLIAKSSNQQSECVRLLLIAGAELNLESYSDSDVRTLYKILIEDNNNLGKKPAFEALLRINEKVKIKEMNRNTNSMMFMSKALRNDEIEIINKILGKQSPEIQYVSLRLFTNEQKSEDNNEKGVSGKCLVM